MTTDPQPENHPTATPVSSPLVLGVDTSSPVATLAVARGAQILSVITDHSGRPHSQTLFQNLEQLLLGARLKLSEVDAFAIATGPGSFTGLRVGMAAVKGLAHTLARPAIGVTTIDAWALAAAARGKVVVMIDAARGEVFCGLREVQNDGAVISLTGREQDFCAPPEAALSRLEALPGGDPPVFIGSGVARYRDLIEDTIKRWGRKSTGLLTDQPALAPFIARYAGHLLTAGNAPPVQAYYIRPADAKLPQPHA
ncbi:MAG TPA: tRNA (adenosine(37)-N6)-threonylcarbamoyltransferase complex dimerization subunit type 1 TsaB [Blastocatellia bacterium]|nr:tRNA (adenosine(37)-N6)-threonylcarbamoyltransferase complex dimerization subunit type 1 TsaB [Blastocatellia bacterium]